MLVQTALAYSILWEIMLKFLLLFSLTLQTFEYMAVSQRKCISLNSFDNEKVVFSVSDTGSSAEKIRVFPMVSSPDALPMNHTKLAGAVRPPN